MPRLSKLSRSVAGRAVLVTGAASGMGRATAHLFADEGALVAVTDLKQEAVDAVVKEITDAGGKARGWVFDVGSREAIERVVKEVAEAFGRLDIIVNNAGLATVGSTESSRFEETWAKALDVMLTGPARIVRAALPYLRKSDCARVVNIASTHAGRRGLCRGQNRADRRDAISGGGIWPRGHHGQLHLPGRHSHRPDREHSGRA
jgi:3-oxoacyl-[acyl-carrier protein] reductase